MKRLTKFTLMMAAIGLCVAGAWPLAAQTPTFDSSGNSLLNGTYYFRQVFYILADSNGDLSEAASVYGHITFYGNGTYAIPDGLVMDSANEGEVVTLACETSTDCTSATQAGTVTGTYTISASGYGYLSNPITGESTYVMVANAGTTPAGIITGSTTETSKGYNDLFIAALNGSPQPSTGTFNGSYTIAGFIPGGTPAGGADLFFQLNPNGGGSLGNVSASGYIGSAGTTIETQNISNVKYIFSNGAAVLQFPNSTSTSAFYFSGNEYLYFSPDGNFVFGGSPNGYDMLVGIRNDSSSTTENFSGLYYQGGIDQDVSQYATSGYALFDTYYGSLSAAGGGNIIAEQRELSPLEDASAYSYSYYDSYPVPIIGSGSVTDSNTDIQYAYGDSGTVRIGAGVWPYLGLTVAFQAATPTQTTSVFLSPTGVTNAASSAPFTSGIADGELLTLYGTNLAPAGLTIASAIPFPTMLNGVQVTVNGQYAPVYYVSPGQVSVIVPYENPYSVAEIQVINNGTASNVVTEFVDETAAGLFTSPAGGIGYAVMVHNATGQLVTPQNPAEPGEYLYGYVTGLGKVFPPVQDGAAGPSSPLSNSIYFSSTASENQINAFIGGVSAPVVYAGLAPGFAGLYQIDLQVPAGLTAGDNDIDISGPDSYSSEALISVGSGLLADESPEAGTAAKKAAPRVRRGKPTTTKPALKQAPQGLLGRGLGSLK